MEYINNFTLDTWDHLISDSKLYMGDFHFYQSYTITV